MSDETYGPGDGPAGRPMADEEIATFLATHQFGVLATTTSDGAPHSGIFVFAWDADRQVARISTRVGRIKPVHLRRDPRFTLHVPHGDFLSYVLARGNAEVTDPSTEVGDAVGLELLAMTGIEDETDQGLFLAQMVKDQRLVLRLHVARLTGFTLLG